MKSLAGILICLVSVLLPQVSRAQVTPGLPPFSSEDSHQYDTINLGDLHIVVQIPLRDKAAGPLPFSYDLVMNNYLYDARFPHAAFTYMGLKGSLSGFGPDGLNPYVSPSNQATNSSHASTCSDGTATTIYDTWVYADSAGTVHPFSLQVDSKGCIAQTAQGQATDGSGFTLRLSSLPSLTSTLFDLYGNRIAPLTFQRGPAVAIASVSTPGLSTSNQTQSIVSISDAGVPPSAVITVTLANAISLPLVLSDSLQISGVPVAGYNGTWAIKSISVDGKTFQLSGSSIPGGLSASGGGSATTNNFITLVTSAPHNLNTSESVFIAGAANANYNTGFSVRAVPNSTTAILGYTNAFSAQPPSGGGTATAQITQYPQLVDPDGNAISTWSSYNGRTGITSQGFIDSLGQNVWSTSVFVNNQTAPNVYTFLDASGTTRSVTVNRLYSPGTTYLPNFPCGNGANFNQYSGDSERTAVANIVLADQSTFQFTYEQTPGNPSAITGRLASITLPTGGQIQYAYSGGVNGLNCSDLTTATLTRMTPDGSWTYTHTPPASGSKLSTTTVVDPQGNETDYLFFGQYQLQRKVFQLVSGVQTLLGTDVTCYNGNFANCTNVTSITPPITRTDIYWTPSGTGAKTTLTETIYNLAGQVTQTNVFDYGVNVGAAPTGSPIRATMVTYDTSVPNSISPSCVQVTAGASPPTCRTVTANTNALTTYTNYNAQGHVGTISQWVSGTTSLSKNYTYTSNGQIHTIVDVNGAPGTSTYTYGDCNGLLPTSISEPMSLSRSMTWDCLGGVQTSATDENGNSSSANYLVNSSADPFYRVLQTIDRAGNPTNYAYSPTTAENSLAVNAGASTVDDLVTVDSLGRPYLRQRKQSPTVSTYDSVQAYFDTSGRSKGSSLPYSGTAGQTSSSSAGTVLYDASDRVLSSTDAGGGFTQNAYSANDVLVTVGPAPAGENTKQKQLEYDALGRLTSVCEITTVANGGGNCAQNNPRTGYWTRYTYDAMGRILSVTQNAQASTGQQARTYQYDGLGRLTSEANPESGTTLYFYDAAPSSPGSACAGSFPGDLVKKYDANGNTTCNAYDALHRLISKTYSGPNSTGVNQYFVYDAATINGQLMANAKGRIAEAYTAACPTCGKSTDEGFSYTPRGELAASYESTTNSGGYYSIPMTYWENGAMKSFGPFLNEDSLGFTVDGEGRTLDVHSLIHASTPVSGITYNVASQPTGLNTACNPTCRQISYLYDPNTLRMTNYSVPLTNGTLSGALTWNPNGSMQKLSISDPANPPDSQTCNYAADDLGRLTSANCGTPWSQTFSYDPFGNITKSGSLAWNPGYTRSTNHYASGSGSTYDANGNLTSDGFNTYTWDAEGKPLTTHYGSGGNAGQTWSFLYDAFGHKAEWAINGTYKDSFVTLGKFKMMAQGQTADYSEYPLPGGSVYSVNGGATGYQIADWQGTIRGFYSLGGALAASGAHAPFGEYYANTGGVNWAYTGQRSMGDGTVNATYYFPERDYRNAQGRWLSPDPAGMSAVDPSDPQSWNRYAYVGNSPLNRIDPLGLDDSGCTWDPKTGTLTCPGPDAVLPYSTFGLNLGFQPAVSGARAWAALHAWLKTKTLIARAKNARAKLKNAYCKAIPTGRSISLSGAVGGLGAVSGEGDMVLNYNSGQSSLFATGGMAFGWNGGVSLTATSGLVYGLDSTNNGYSGLFKGASLYAPTPVPFVGAGGSVIHGGDVKVISLGASAALVGKYGGGISTTNTSQPLDVGNFVGFSMGDFAGYLARLPCN